MTTFFRLIIISLFALNSGHIYDQVKPPEIEIVAPARIEAVLTCQSTEFLQATACVKYTAFNAPALVLPLTLSDAQDQPEPAGRIWFQSSPRNAAHRGSTREAHSTL